MEKIITLDKLKWLKETEHKVEFKEAKTQYRYKGDKKSVLCYVTALANEGGGMLVFGMTDKYPHEVVGSSYFEEEEGKLEQNIHDDLKIRVNIEVLKDDQNRRVMVLIIPKRPVGRPLYCDNIAWMRVGDELLRMSDEKLFEILSESEPDYSARICDGLSVGDLNTRAIQVLKERYAAKTNNTSFLSMPEEQVLRDLGLLVNGELNYAALILLGSKEAINKYLPQAKVIVEYRQAESQIPFDKREEFTGPLFLTIDEVWKHLDSRNGDFHIQTGPYILDIPYFNEAVIREALLNAICHRDYTLTSEIVVKQFPRKIIITNPGGLPKGVTFDNILTVNSTPRSRLLADVLLKTGLVERSGQGVDKMFYLSLSEGKAAPDYTHSDSFQVTLILSGDILHKGFALFIKNEQTNRPNINQLGVEDIITLDRVRDSRQLTTLNKDSLNKLIEQGLIIKRSRKTGVPYVLSEHYEALNEEVLQLDLENDPRRIAIVTHLQANKTATMADFIQLYDNKLTRRQIYYFITRLLDQNIIYKKGKGAGTIYMVNENIDVID